MKKLKVSTVTRTGNETLTIEELIEKLKKFPSTSSVSIPLGDEYKGIEKIELDHYEEDGSDYYEVLLL